MSGTELVPVQLTPKHLETMFGSLQDCCLHSPVWTPVDVDKVLCSVHDADGEWRDSTPPADRWGAWKTGTESTSYTVVRLKDGRFGLLSESEDYTGHGCQCTAATNVYDSVNDLVRLGVEEWQSGARDAIRQRLAVPGAVVADSGELEAGK
jgi:hypothetical protein